MRRGRRKPDLIGGSRGDPARRGPRSAAVHNRTARPGSLWVLFCALVAIVSVAGCKSGVTLPTGVTALEQRGYQIFTPCYFHCHIVGSDYKRSYTVKDGAAGFPPDLRKTPPRSDDWYRAYLLNPRAVLPHSPMPSFGYFSDKDFEALAAFLKYLDRDVVVKPPETITAKSIPETPAGLEGYNAGRQIYLDNCEGCHGEWGNGGGPVGQILSPEPRDFTDSLWMSKQSEVYLFSIITNGKPKTAMQPFRELLSPRERALVMRYIHYFADPVAKERMELGEIAPES